MKTILKPLHPQPVLADPKPPGRWIWGPVEPITDFVIRDGKFDASTATAKVSWWNDNNTCSLMEAHYPESLPKTAKVQVIYDGERWSWVITLRGKTKL